VKQYFTNHADYRTYLVDTHTSAIEYPVGLIAGGITTLAVVLFAIFVTVIVLKR